MHLGHKWLRAFKIKKQPTKKNTHLHDFKILNSECDSGQFEGKNRLISVSRISSVLSKANKFSFLQLEEHGSLILIRRRIWNVVSLKSACHPV